MNTIFDILTLSAEPALLSREGTLVFANAAARGLLGGDCVGKQTAALLGLAFSLQAQESCLVQTQLNHEAYLLRVSRLEDGVLIFLERQQDAPALLNSAFLYYLRTNLMALGVAADTLRPLAEDLGQAEMLETLTGLTRSYYKLMRLSENMTLTRQLFEGGTTLNAARLDLSLLCHALLDAVEEHLPELCIQRDIPSGLALVADARLLRLLLFNLLSNAIRHGQAKTLRLSVQCGASHMLLSLSDDGAGIPEETLSTVFCRYRCNTQPQDALGGIGLGLSAARAVTQLHNGALLLESRVNQGTLVRASLSRELMPGTFCSGGALCDMRELLLGLADVLPEDCFREKYLD